MPGGEWRVCWGHDRSDPRDYEDGKLRPLDPLDLAEYTVVRIAVETAPEDAERKEWLEQGERTLTGVWDDLQDEVYNELSA